MIDLNDLKQAVNTRQVDRDQVRAVVRDGQIVDFLTVDDKPRAGEEVRTMPLVEMLLEVFEQK